MKLRLVTALIFFAAIAAIVAAQQSAGAGPLDIAVAFWNVKWFPGGRPNASRAEEMRQTRSVQAEITQVHADVLGLEEVRDWDNAALAVQPLEGFKVDVCSNFPPREGQDVGQQVAITSRLEPMSAWAEAWKPGSAITPPRGFAFAAYEIAKARLLLLYTVHLKSNRGEVVEDIAIREEAMHQLYSHMVAMQQAYGKLGTISWVVGGDFNTAPGDPRFKEERTTHQLMEHGFGWIWQNMPLSERTTMPAEARFPAACFDHMFFHGPKLKTASVLKTSTISSDHRAIRAEFEMP